MNKLKQMKGITLIALIITIIVLLILAGVTLAMVMGDNGIIAKAQTAKERTNASQEGEQEQLESLEDIVDNYNIGDRADVLNSPNQPIATFTKDASTTGGDYWITNAAVTKNYDQNYFSYDDTNGLTVEKNGWYLIEMSSHISATGEGRLKIKINNTEHKLDMRYAGDAIGAMSGNMTTYLKKGDKLNACYSCDNSGPNHKLEFIVYTFN